MLLNGSLSLLYVMNENFVFRKSMLYNTDYLEEKTGYVSGGEAIRKNIFLHFFFVKIPSNTGSIFVPVTLDCKRFILHAILHGRTKGNARSA